MTETTLDNQVYFTRLFPSGETTLRKPLHTLILEIINYLPTRKLPPYAILNLYLKKGCVDFGMSGGVRWDSFELSPIEYKKFLTDFNYDDVKAPDWVVDELTWAAWCYHQESGVSPKLFLDISRKSIDLNKKLQKAIEKGDKQLTLEAELELAKVSKAMFDLFKPY